MTDDEPEAPTLTGKERAAATRRSWKPGQSGNPSGRPKLPEEYRQLITQNLDVVVELLLDTVMSEGAETKDRVKAAEVLLSYGLAKPSTDAAMTGAAALAKLADAIRAKRKAVGAGEPRTLEITAEGVLADDEERDEEE